MSEMQQVLEEYDKSGVKWLTSSYVTLYPSLIEITRNE